MLVGAGVDANAKGSDGRSALHIAAFAGHAGVCEVLVGLGADVASVNSAGEAAADIAATGRNSAVSARLRTSVRWERGGEGVDEVRLDETAREVVVDGLCGLGVALVGVGIEGGSGAMVRRGVLEGDVNLNAEAWYGKWSIEYAIMCGDSDDVVEALIECGVDVNFGSGQHLRHAALRGRARVCGALIRGGADLSSVDGYGDTALHNAASKGHLGVCEVLVASGANVGVVNKLNKTAAARATEFGHDGIAAFLERS
jgi:ankyrin repeat protein